MKPLYRACVVAGMLALLVGCSDARPQPERTRASSAALEATWSPAAAMSTGRFRHTATQLLDGKLLIVGGATVGDPERRPGIGSSPTASAELFDPVSGKFVEVGALARARWGHSSTLLRDGRVLIGGGFDDRGAALASAELYDPTSRSFVDAGAMHHARGLHTATLLEDDRVLLLGGLAGLASDVSPDTNVASVMEAYEPSTSRFEELGSASALSFPHAAMLLGDGRVAVAWPERAAGFGAIELAWFHPSSDALVSAGQVPCVHPCQDLLLHYEPSLAGQASEIEIDIVTAQEEISVVPQGDLVLPENVGHADHAIDVFYVEGTQVENNLFENTGSGASAAMTSSTDAGASRPLLVGGWMNQAQRASTSNSLLNTAGWQRGRLAAGEAEPCAAAEACARWTSVGQLGEPRAWPTATSLASGVLVTGGMGQSPLASVEERPVGATTATSVLNLDVAASFGHAATLLGDGGVLFTGSYTESTTAFVLPSVGETPTPVGSLLAQRAWHQSFLLPSGQVLLAAGETSPKTANEELFDVASGKSVDLGFRLQARHSGLALTRNRYLFASEGGLELLDANTFTTQRIESPEPLGCPAPGLARLLNGRVAVVGRASVFELDVERLRASVPVALPTPRCDPAVTALPDGTLAIIGGVPEQGHESPAFEKYDPATLSVSAAPSLPGAAGVISARPVLRFSKLLLVGGVSWWPDGCPMQPCAQGAPQVVNWSSGAASDWTFFGKYLSDSQSVTTLADGSLLRASPQDEVLNEPWKREARSTPARIELMPTDASNLRRSGPPREVTPGAEVELTGLALSKTWPENSGGTSQGSATNSPIAMWIPVLDGWPVTGTLSHWSEDRATWRVPHPAFPGLGIFGYVRSGTWHPLELVRISDQDAGGVCAQNSECGSGYCVDGVCCDRACDGTCEACTAALKGAGADGVCEAAAAETPEAACAADQRNPCGNTGLCDGSGACAVAPDGESCADQSECMQGICVQQAEIPAVAVCVDEATAKNAKGVLEPCEDGLRCWDGACKEECVTSKDCVRDLVCNSKQECVEPVTKPNTISGCAPSCRVTRREPLWTELWSLGLGLLVVARRRRARPARCLPGVPATKPV